MPPSRPADAHPALLRLPCLVCSYAVSKTALVGLTKALAEERAGQQRVNCVCPGIVPTKASSGRKGACIAQCTAVCVASTPMREEDRVCNPRRPIPAIRPPALRSPIPAVPQFAAALVASPELEEENRSRTLVGRLGTPGDMAAAVAFLASEDASYITGEAIVVAGGMQSRL